MSWGLRFRVRQYVKGSLWVFPVLGGVAGSLIGFDFSEMAERVMASPAEALYEPLA